MWERDQQGATDFHPFSSTAQFPHQAPSLTSCSSLSPILQKVLCPDWSGESLRVSSQHRKRWKLETRKVESMINHNTENELWKSCFQREELLLKWAHTQFILLLGINRCQERRAISVFFFKLLFYQVKKKPFISTYLIVTTAIDTACISQSGNNDIKLTNVFKILINCFGCVSCYVKSKSVTKIKLACQQIFGLVLELLSWVD